MKLELHAKEIAHPGGLEIAVDGFTDDPRGVKPAQVLIEVYEGKLRVHVWTDGSEDPTVTTQIHPLPVARTAEELPPSGHESTVA